MLVFEDRATYDQTKDSVTTITVSVECNPGEAASVTAFLVGASSKAGVYSVAVDHVVHIPEVTGEVHGEQAIQQPSDEPQAAVDGDGSSAAEAGATEVVAEHVEPELAGATGEITTEGPSERDS